MSSVNFGRGGWRYGDNDPTGVGDENCNASRLFVDDKDDYGSMVMSV